MSAGWLLVAAAACSREEPAPPPSVSSATPDAGTPNTEPAAPRPTTPTGTATPGTTTPRPRVAPRAIRDVDFTNFTFPTDSCGDIFERAPRGGYSLQGGEAHRGTPADPEFYAVYLRDDIAYGDLDGDGVEEAVVVLDCTPGNRPFGFASVWRATEGGGAARAAKVESTGVDPGRGELRLYEADITAGAVDVTWQVFGPEDPSCCPSELARVRLRLAGDTLEPIGEATYGPAPPPG
jgi:hypothetical protein